MRFSRIIGLIKRAQRIYGRAFTVSGARLLCGRFAKIGYWSPDMITEDIDVSWRLQLAHWDVRYEPNVTVLDIDAGNAERFVF